MEQLESRIVLAATLDLGKLLPENGGDGSIGVTFFGADADDRSGTAVHHVGDVNGDGFDDLLLGAPDADGAGNAKSAVGESYVVFGKADWSTTPTLDLATLNGINGFTLFGVNAGDNSGVALSGAGDVNGDGFDDLLIGAHHASGLGGFAKHHAGESYVVFGKADWSTSPTVDLATLNGTNGFNLFGIDRYDASGSALSDAGDVNGDGFDDLLIGAGVADAAGNAKLSAGESYVVFGKADWSTTPTLDLATLNGPNGFTLFGVDWVDFSGSALSGAGDVNGDGFDDLLIGAYRGDGAGNAKGDAGESYVVFGKADWSGSPTLDLGTLNGTNGFTLFGVDSVDKSGRALSGAGDVNGDGFDDLLIGADRAGAPGNANFYEGESYVVFGKADWSTSSTLDLATLNGINGFTLFGIDRSDYSGRAVSRAGDVNRDGFDDLLIGANGADAGGNAKLAAGESYVVFGMADWSASPRLALATLDGTSGFTLFGVDTLDRSGVAVSGGGDVNGDGFADLLIGARLGRAAGNAKSSAGESYVVFGGSSTVVVGPKLTIEAADAIKPEGNSGITPFTFTVTRSGNTGSTPTVNYAVTGSGATPANAADFGGAFPSGTVTFAANEPSKLITINVAGDTLSEPDEGFTVTLSNASSGATITTAFATGTIQNDDGTFFTVTNVNDSGAGSLRQAILNANATAGRDIIQFSIGSGARTINLVSALPLVTDGVVIDATTQPGFAGRPLIELDGTNAGNSDGLKITAGNSVVRGLVIRGFQQSGIVLADGDNNVVEGNYIGTDVNGAADLGNAQDGVVVENSANNVIGGSALATRNVVSGNDGFGIVIQGVSSTNNVIAGNNVGVTASGLAVLGNGASGVWIRQAAHDNRIGTNGDGANDVGERNLISGNGFDGIAIEGVGTNGNIVAGNFIGTDNTGTVALGGNHFAVKITNGAKSNRIGTNGDGVADASERNILSGNLWDGVFIADMGTDGNVVAGNYIGVDVNGASALGNNFGVRIDNGAKSNRIGTDANGVADTAERNVISGNRNDGVLIIGADTQNNIIAGNYIGTNASGTAALANAFYGITIQNSPNNIIGGITTAARNVISGNGATGVSIREASATGNKVQGNYVGTDAAGTAAVPNWNGIEIREGAKSNRVGSNADGANDDAERNVISGNTFSGISISGAGTETNVVAGNYIGTNALGTEALANKLVGVAISDAANNIIGGVATAARNVISGNKYSGVVIREAGATGNKVQGNYVGTNAAGAAAVPNHFNGVMVFQGASNNLIGGASLGMGNVVSGNTNAGIRIETAGTTGNVIQGNLVGVAADGVTALGNTPGDESGWGSFRG